MLDRVEQLGNRLLPAGWLRETIRQIYRRQHNPLYSVAPLVRAIFPIDDETIQIELSEGYHLRGLADHVLRPVFECADPARLGPLRPYGRWATFFQIIGEVYASKVYSRRYSPRPGDVILDLGAHVGTFAVYAAKQVGPKGRVIAFEPSSSNFQLLQQNACLNRLENLDLLNRGAWDREADLDLALSPMSSSHSLYVGSSPAPRNGQIERIHVSTVDQSLAELGIDRVQFVKMDIEGAEVEVLRGMDQLIKRCQPAMAVAAYHTVSGMRTSGKVAAVLQSFGFVPENVHDFVYVSHPPGP